MEDQDHQIPKYDRLYGGMRDVCLHSRPSTIKNVDLTGRSETFIVETMRHAEKGDNFCPACNGLGDKQGPEALDADVALAEVLTA
jgi:hypothetical protein